MSSDAHALLWFPRLEKTALVQLGLASLTCLGAPEASYNIVLGGLQLWSSLVRVGRVNLLCMRLQLLSFGVDLLALATRSDAWAHKGLLSALSLALFILLLFVKSVALLCMLIIHGEVGAANTAAAGAIGLTEHGAVAAATAAGSFSSSRPPSSLGHQQGRLSRSGSFAQPMTPSHGSFAGGGEPHEQHALLGGQAPRAVSPGPASGSFRVPVAAPLAVHGYQASQ